MQSDMQQARKSKGRYRVGDRVTFEFGGGKVIGTIIEDRGDIGVGGRHLYQIEVPMTAEEPMVFELPEPVIELIPNGDQPKRKPAR